MIVAIKGEKTTVEYVSSNQVVRGSSPSGRAIISTTYSALKFCTLLIESESSYWILIFKVVIGGWEATVGSVSNSGWFAYRPTTLGDSSSAKGQYWSSCCCR